ncbi:hypothetical protein UFOVP1366_33 [uncultured Caudovirales phage]|uniref:Uncharacterized protein n=1 Tax=uncultured Caudovirales phage TaxID=2100421 RepID=A0A6J5RVY1_9CAUD|nr:hypothetical protein UFOVP1366_33 [uncultured Caudovirales phage]
MANQMIALQARGPQMPDMGAQLARFGNMMARQQVANRQSEVAQQTMDIAKAQEARAVSADKIKMNADKIDLYTIRAGQTMTPEGYAVLLQDLDKDAPDIAAHFRANLPEANFDRNMLLRMVGSIGDNFKATYGPLETEVVTLEDGTLGVARTGGFGGPGAEPGVFELEQFKLDPTRGTRGPPPVAAPPPAAGAPPVAAPPPAAGAPPQTPPQTPTGGMRQPISYTGGQPQGADPRAELAKGMEDAMRTKQISPELVDQLRQIDPRASAAVDQFLQTNNIQVLPSGGMRSAVYRPGVDGAPQMQQVQDMPNYRPTGRPARAKDPMQAPTPGSATVPLERVRGEAEAGRATPAQAAAVAKATKVAESQAQKDAAFPDAQAQFEAGIALIDNRLADVERFREHPAASRVIGELDAFTPNTFRARGAQKIYDALVATATLDELQQMRQNSPTGGALGNVSDADIRILRQSIGALGQDQSEEDFNDSLNIFEARLKSTRDRMIRRYRENYGYKVGKDFQPPAPTSPQSTPTNGGRKAGGFTVMEVGD